MVTRKKLPPQEVLKKLFRYDPETGKLFWLSRLGRRGGRPIGSEAGHVPKNPKPKHQTAPREIRILGKMYFAHNIIWVLVTGREPDEEIDHENRDSSDNRWCNLREATRSQNQANTSLYKNNKLRMRGIHLSGKKTKRYRAVISQNGRNYHIGYFDTIEAAQAAWRKAASARHSEFAAA